jgi:tRNA 2-thiouridine synthesizing protein A
MRAEPFPADDDMDDDDSLPLRELQRLIGGGCVDCGVPYSARDAVSSIALGFKNAPRCLACLGQRLGRVETELREQLTGYVHRRECYLKAWRVAEQTDGVHLESALDSDQEPAREQKPDVQQTATTSTFGGEVSERWNAGDMGCGELVMALRIRMNKLAPGSVLEVQATDPAAPEDLPAWCRLCGHTLLQMNHPSYWIRRKGD